MTADNRTNEQLSGNTGQFTAEQVVAEALVGTLLTGSRELSPEQREDVVAIVVAALRDAGMLKDTRPVIDREAVAREVYRELYPGTIGTHDSKRTPESDLAEADRAYLTWDNGNEGFAPGIVCRRVADRVIAHLDADMTDETEWEYRARTDYGRVVAQGSLDEIGHLSGHIWERRRKAGEWEEIPNE